MVYASSVLYKNNSIVKTQHFIYKNGFKEKKLNKNKTNSQTRNKESKKKLNLKDNDANVNFNLNNLKDITNSIKEESGKSKQKDFVHLHIKPEENSYKKEVHNYSISGKTYLINSNNRNEEIENNSNKQKSDFEAKEITCENVKKDDSSSSYNIIKKTLKKIGNWKKRNIKNNKNDIRRNLLEQYLMKNKGLIGNELNIIKESKKFVKKFKPSNRGKNRDEISDINNVDKPNKNSNTTRDSFFNNEKNKIDSLPKIIKSFKN